MTAEDGAMVTDLPLVEALMASLADAVYFVDAAGEVSFVNPAAVAVLGYHDELELLGCDSHATIHSHHRDGVPFPEHECPLLRPRVSGETVRVELDWFIRRDGSFVPVSYASAPMATPEGRGAVVVFRDVSQRLAPGEFSLSRARIAQAADEERRRIGRDLHDGAQQRLVQVLMSVEEGKGGPAAGGAGPPPPPPPAPAPRARAVADARRAIDDLRDLVNGIHPLVLTDRGVAVALEELTAGAPVAVEFDVTEERFAPEIEAAAYFTVVEALTNVAKHADADGAEVTIRREGDRLTIEVVDDGRGGAALDAGSGLRGLQDRLAVLGGWLAI